MVGCSDNEVKPVEVTSALDAAENGNGRRVDGDSMLAMLAEGVTWRNVKFRRGMSPDCANCIRFRRSGWPKGRGCRQIG